MGAAQFSSFRIFQTALCRNHPRQYYSNRNGVVPRHCKCNVEFSGETKGLIRFMVPMPEAF